MDAEGIGLVLARASELHSKINNCILKSQTDLNSTKEGKEIEDKISISDPKTIDSEEVEESLSNIRDAFESLEVQLASLQELQQQQFYERELALAEIDHSRQKLLKKLKDYKGKDLEVISEATAFASETVDENNDLLLPPYPSRPSRSLVSENGYLSHFPSTRKFGQNGVASADPTNELSSSLYASEKNRLQSESKSPFKRVRVFINVAAKAVLTLVGVISVLSLAGVEPRLRKRGTQNKFLVRRQLQGTEEKRPVVHCPPGKVLVVENGETRCLVKERFEIPFDSAIETPDVNYGCG